MLVNNYIRLGTVNAIHAFHINSDDRIGIGTTEVATEYKLRCEELKVMLKSASWPDYVFNKNYDLMPLKELEIFIKENKFLPGIPSAKEIAEDGGFEVGEIQRLQMEKIEELYLYIIDLNKKVENLEKENKMLNNKIKNKR